MLNTSTGVYSFIPFGYIRIDSQVAPSQWEVYMLEFVRSLRRRRDFWTRLPAFALAFLVAEIFYKFKSFSVECAAFLVTWLIIDVIVDQLAKRLEPPKGRSLQ
jgi:hypothetical protein